MKKIITTYVLLDLAYWISWIPTSLHLFSLGGNPTQKSLYVVLLFLFTRLPRFFLNPTIGAWIDSKNHAALGGPATAILLAIISTLSVCFADSALALVCLTLLRSIAYGILEVSRVPAISKMISEPKRKKSIGLIALQPHVIMGLASAIGGSLAQNFGFLTSLHISATLTLTSLLFSDYRQILSATHDRIKMINPFRRIEFNTLNRAATKLYSERFLSTLLNGSNPLLVNLYFQKTFTDAGPKYGAYMTGIAIGCSLAFIFPITSLPNASRRVILVGSAVFQLMMFRFGQTLTLIAGLTTVSVFLQFLFFRVSTTDLVESSEPDKVASTMASLSQIDILAAIIAHGSILLFANYFEGGQVYLCQGIISIFCSGLVFLYLMRRTNPELRYAR